MEQLAGVNADDGQEQREDDLGDYHDHQRSRPGQHERRGEGQGDHDRDHPATVQIQLADDQAAQPDGGDQRRPVRPVRDSRSRQSNQPERTELEHRLRQQRSSGHQQQDAQNCRLSRHRAKRDGDMAGQRHTFGGFVQLGLVEPDEPDDRQPDQRDRGEVGEACRGVLSEHAACQRTDHEGGGFHRADSADPLFVELAGAGLLQHRVVHDAVHGPGAEREVDSEDHGRHHVGDHVVAQPADQ